MILYVLFLLFSNFIGAVSQVLLKKSALESHKSFVREYLNVKVVLAYALFFAAVFIDLTALKIVPVSYVRDLRALAHNPNHKVRRSLSCLADVLPRLCLGLVAGGF